MKPLSYVRAVFLTVLLFRSGFSQEVDHWETVIYAGDEWSFFVGISEPASDWNSLSFNDSSWAKGAAGIGYGDDDDETEIDPTISLYMRIKFVIEDADKISNSIFNIDYDDAFVAYLNGMEIARSNIGETGDVPAYNQTSNGLHEAQMYYGGEPDYSYLSGQKTSELLKTGNNILAIQIHNESITSSDMSAIPFFSVGIKDDSFTYRNVPSWFKPPFNFDSSNLPIIIINTGGESIPYEPKIDAQMGIVNNGSGNRNYVTDFYNEYDGHIGIEVRGQSSLGFEKKSYGLETRDSLGENLNVSLLGMPKENDWVLHGPYSDKSLMRNALTYSLAAGLGHYAPRVQFCEVVLNDTYRGVYVFTEKIKRDDDRVNVTKMLPQDINEPEVTGGYIFKKDKVNEGDNIISLTRGLELIITEPKNDNIVPEQTTWLLNYLNSFENVLYGNGDYTEYINVQSFVDNFLIVEFTKNIDGLRLSTYFHKDRNGKIIASPVWDYNLSLGNADYNDGWAPIGWYYPIISSWDKNWWIQLLQDPAFYDSCKTRWAEIRKGQFAESNIISMIDEWVELLDESQKRNFEYYNILGKYIWPNPGFPESGSFGYDSPTSGGPTTWQEEVNYLKDFIAGRLVWMDDQLEYDPTSLDLDDRRELQSFELFQNYPNPFNAQTTIRFSLGSKSNILITIYDTQGRTIKTILKALPAGDHSVKLNTADLASGVYFYRLKSGSIEKNRKMLLLK
ncbi:MAG: T9SS type A sorting domain-containing protein [Calditrichaeota bacterium]|nr:T9SS type A sorting domain-containing protein [Calditrichota bacterium]